MRSWILSKRVKKTFLGRKTTVCLSLVHNSHLSLALSLSHKCTQAHTHKFKGQAPGGICFLQPGSEVNSLSLMNPDVTFDFSLGRPLTLRC